MRAFKSNFGTLPAGTSGPGVPMTSQSGLVISSRNRARTHLKFVELSSIAKLELPLRNVRQSDHRLRPVFGDKLCECVIGNQAESVLVKKAMKAPNKRRGSPHGVVPPRPITQIPQMGAFKDFNWRPICVICGYRIWLRLRRHASCGSRVFSSKPPIANVGLVHAPREQRSYKDQQSGHRCVKADEDLKAKQYKRDDKE